MKKQVFIVLFTLLFCTEQSLAQNNLLNAKVPQEIGFQNAEQLTANNTSPIAYGYVDDRDVLWSKTIWEIIDLDERINFPLLYPVDTTVVGPERRPMIWWLKQEITRGRLDVYDPESEDGEFRRKLTDPVELENIWRKQSVLEAGKITIEDFQTFIDEDILTKEFDRFGFVPYEYYDVENEEIIILSEEQKAEIAADSIGTVFPYIIKNSKELNFNVYQDSVISFELYNGFRQDIPVRKVMPGYDKSELDNEEVTDIRRICLQLIRDYWIEDTHFIWEDLKFSQVKKWLVKGLWYFDKRLSELKYRLLGIAPVAPDVNFMDTDKPDLVELFWVFFPDSREALHNAKTFNKKNSAIPLSFDHVLNSRRFNGYVYQEENVQGDRKISEYISDNALMQLLESDRVKDKIRNFEMDMWSY